MIPSRRLIDRAIGPLLGLVALVVYAATLSSGAYPGRSASLIVQTLGLFPRLRPTSCVWHAVTWVVSGVPLGSPVWRLNALSALCGAVSVWLLYEVVVVAVRAVIEPDSRRQTLVRSHWCCVLQSLP